MNDHSYINAINLQHPELSTSSLNDLDHLVRSSKRLRMAVAFWTISPDRISDKLPELLGKDGSFACVDFHRPTNIDHICDLANFGSDIFFHARKIQEKSPDGGFTLPANLLHSKILLFDLNDNEAELWVGSHNWTGWALDGANIETSIRIKINSKAKLYTDTVSLLNSIKKQSYPVVPADRFKYKQIQEPEKTVSAISLNLTPEAGESIKIHSRLYIYCADHNDFKKIPKPKSKNLYITINNKLKKREELYLASVRGTAFLPKDDPSNIWIGLEEGYWAYHQRIHETPLLRSISIPKRSVLESGSIFVVTLVLEEKLSSKFKLFPTSPKPPYIKVDNHSKQNTLKIGELPLDKLDDYQLGEMERVHILYGDKEQLSAGHHETDIDRLHHKKEGETILLGYDGPKPLIQKLVLRKT